MTTSNSKTDVKPIIVIVYYFMHNVEDNFGGGETSLVFWNGKMRKAMSERAKIDKV